MGFVNDGPWANFETEAPDTLENGSVGTNQLVDLSVTTQKLANGSVTTGKLSSALRLSNMRTFDTVATMLAATDLEVGMTCHTNGFYIEGDGGASYYTVSESGTANDMDVLALQGNLFATLILMEPYVMPEQFGAYGNGVEDDSEALEKCADYECPIILVNDYFINQKVTLNNSIFGGGTATIMLPNVEGVYLQNDLEDANINGVNFQSSSKSGYTLYISQPNNTIENCTFQNSGIAIRSFAGINIHNCYLHNATTGIYISNTNEDINISHVSIENELDYKTELLGEPGKSGILLEETTSVANISNVYMSNILENFIYAQAKRAHISDGMFVNGMVVKVVGFDETMAELAVMSNLTFIDTNEARHTGNLPHVQIYDCVDTVYDGIEYVGSTSSYLFDIGGSTTRTCGNVTIKNITGTFKSQLAMVNKCTISKLLFENVYANYSAAPTNTGIVNIADSTISELDIIDSQYVIVTLTGNSSRFFYKSTNSTVTKVLIIGRTNEPFYNPVLLDGIHNIEIISNSYTLARLFDLYNTIKGKDFVVRFEGIILAANSLNSAGSIVNLMIARYRSITVNSGVNARILVYSENDVQDYTLISGLLTKLSGTNSYITQASSGANLLLRGDIKPFNMDVKLLN